MDDSMWIELYGYLGSVLVVVSLLMSSVVKLRVINTLGSVISGSYALIIGSLPLCLMNGCLIVINLYNLRKLKKGQRNFDIVQVGSGDSSLKFFLEYYRKDIQQYFPDFRPEQTEGKTAYMVFCSGNPVGVLLGEKREDSLLEVLLDYSTPAYRDCSVGRFLYEALVQTGVRALVIHHPSQSHMPYLTKMGYRDLGSCHQKDLSDGSVGK